MNKSINIHNDIINKLENFIKNNDVPNLLFHGNTNNNIIKNFIYKIYSNNLLYIKNYVFFVNCGYGKGIKFIREELKDFAKININSNDKKLFKIIILSNCDKLTIDAQSALRRCIEIFSHTTRFFLIVEDKFKLLNPIISRFCEIYIPEKTNLICKNYLIYNYKYLKNIINDLDENSNLFNISENLYNKGFSNMNLIYYINKEFLDNGFKFKLLLAIEKIKKEFRNEKLLILTILNLIIFRSEEDIKNILSF